MVSITKDRNLIHISLSTEQPRPYTLDINTGVFLSQKGSPMKSSPPRFKNYLLESPATTINHNQNTANIAMFLIYFLREWHFNIVALASQPLYLEVLQLCEKLQNISYKVSPHDLQWLRTAPNQIQDKDLPSIAEYMRQHPTYNLRDWYNDTHYARWCQKYNLVADEHLTEPMLRAMYNYRTPLIQENASRTAYYLAKGLYDFIQFAELGLSRCFRLVNDYYNICELMGTTPAKGDFVRNYVEAKRSYQLRKQEFDDRAIEVFQRRRMSALSFEDDKFQVVIPLTAKEIIDEGEAQRNCVGRLYLPRVKQRETHIVFVRLKNDPDHSYITCQVSTDGEIVQYLGFGNRTPDSMGMKFKDKYQNHLYAHWNRD